MAKIKTTSIEPVAARGEQKGTENAIKQKLPQLIVVSASDWLPTIYHLSVFLITALPVARKQEIIKITEQLIEAINNGDFDAYT